MGVARRSFPVLAVEADTIGAIAVIRSLGRAGYPVHAVAQSPAALGLKSRYAARSAVCPGYHTGEIADWTADYVAAHGIRLIVPSESLIMALGERLEEFLPLMAVPDGPGTVRRAFSKSDCHEVLAADPHTAPHLPDSVISDRSEPRLEAVGSLQAPVFLKVDAVHDDQRPSSSRVLRADSPTEARDLVPRLLERYRRVLAQSFVPGRGIGVFLLRWEGIELASFMHRRLHEVPHTGGASSLRESFRDDGVLADARAKLTGLNWQGVAMMEYRYEGPERFHFMELNARFWGSLHLALFAGVDFPALLADAFRGARPTPVHEYDSGVRCRLTFPKDVHYVLSCLKDHDLPLTRRLWPIPEFFVNGLRPRVRSDLMFPGDRSLYFRALARTAGSMSAALARKIGRIAAPGGRT